MVVDDIIKYFFEATKLPGSLHESKPLNLAAPGASHLSTICDSDDFGRFATDEMELLPGKPNLQPNFALFGAAAAAAVAAANAGLSTTASIAAGASAGHPSMIRGPSGIYHDISPIHAGKSCSIDGFVVLLPTNGLGRSPAHTAQAMLGALHKQSSAANLLMAGTGESNP